MPRETKQDRGSTDPRIALTRQRVLDAARKLLVEEGQEAVTPTRLAGVTGISRSTIYRRWPEPDDIIFEAIADDTEKPPFEPSGDVRQDLTRYLEALREGLQAFHTGLLATRIDRAEHDPEVAGMLCTVAENRRDLIADLLDHRREEFAAAQALIVGPLMYQRFLAREEITDELIELVVDSYMQGRPSLPE
ncbi:MAG: TetR/AcrR family transcriptional regulator [Actinomycetota bacterium]|nr:TetR/AcrR family transcriptional regulator [Actinomycetota bacterium]